MWYEKIKDSPFYGIYRNLADYCNKAGIFKKGSFYGFCKSQEHKTKTIVCATYRYYLEFVKTYPEIADKYFFRHYWKQSESSENN